MLGGEKYPDEMYFRSENENTEHSILFQNVI